MMKMMKKVGCLMMVALLLVNVVTVGEYGNESTNNSYPVNPTDIGLDEEGY